MWYYIQTILFAVAGIIAIINTKSAHKSQHQLLPNQNIQLSSAIELLKVNWLHETQLSNQIGDTTSTVLT